IHNPSGAGLHRSPEAHSAADQRVRFHSGKLWRTDAAIGACIMEHRPGFWYSAAPGGRDLEGHTMGAVRLAVFGATWSLAFGALAWAEGPVAVVEEVSGKSAGVEFMDYVTPGKVIRLGRQDTIVLGYLKSCWRETIVGGTVTVGTEQSDVQGGRVERTQGKCDAGRMQLSGSQAVPSAGHVSRSVELPSREARALERQETAAHHAHPK